VLRAFWSVFILFRIIIPVFEEKYQPIDRHTSEDINGSYEEKGEGILTEDLPKIDHRG
jgi:hypothetical protein